ncbi:SDR family oxidoreductase [Fulvivirga kasyanovii]|uniref:SDR family oxidoreductase n=1 Tax=Fulvivirga kasyanovii TaxID=396812 RepID=A0ABW9RRF3_9BACT|nr:SDR family oxidoreductase [Fulvivirga kasyanovii]MTI26753.1 SDR family oxidoreductase [Fulvivirga kasyanovii]
MEKVLVVGANGLTGTEIIKILKNHGQYDPIAMIRDESQKSKFDEMGIETRTGDLEKDLSQVVEGVNKIIFAAGSGSETGPDKTVAVDQEGAKKLIDEAKSHDIKKFVMLSSMGADEPESHEKLKHYLEAKHNADEHLINSGLNYTIVRPGRLVNGDHQGHIHAGEKLHEQGQITREDVAQVLVAVLDHSQVRNRTFEIVNGDKSIEEALAEL